MSSEPISNESDSREPAARRTGRPRKGEAPRLPYEELDRLLVFGEAIPCENGAGTSVHYPSYRELASRYDVAHSLIAQYAKRHDCMRRRAEAQARVAARTDQKLVELRARSIALSRHDALRIVDSYLAGFEAALAEGRVRFDSPGDFNTMVRLKSFLEGDADSRQEVHATLTLEDIQARHQRMLRVAAASAAERGTSAPRPEAEGEAAEVVVEDATR